MKNSIFYVFGLALCSFPIVVEAASERSALVSLMLNLLPMIIFIVVLALVMKFSMKKTNSVNERIAKSNEDIKDQLERIANALEKKG